MPPTCKTMRLAGGDIGYRDSGGTGLPIVFVHGVCGSKEVFDHQFDEALAGAFRLVAFDLPGHGASEDAADPEARYPIRALTNTTLDVMNYLRLPRALVVGWSLGGHIAMEMMDRFPERLAGVLTVGAPPLARGPLAMMRAFHANPDLLLIRKPHFTTRDAMRWEKMCYGPNPDGLHFASILRADGRMRPYTNRSVLKGGIANQRRVAETSAVPLAMVNGSDDPIMRLSYLDSLRYANLWERRQHIIAGAEHAAFLSHPDSFNPLLGRFATDMARMYPGPYEANRDQFSVSDFAHAAEPRSRRRVAR